MQKIAIFVITLKEFYKNFFFQSLYRVTPKENMKPKNTRKYFDSILNNFNVSVNIKNIKESLK